MNYSFIAKTEIFRGISEGDTISVLNCLQAYTKTYKKGEYVYREGSHIEACGMILLGSVNIEQNDVWGNKSIIDNIDRGQTFAENYACIPDELLMVDVVAAEDSEVLFLNIDKVLKTCPTACDFHSRLVRNLLSAIAKKNINLTRKINHITPKSIRGRLLAYLSHQAVKQGKYSFDIPFNRQQLADYLCVDRSAMSNELGKMRNEGILSFDKNKFYLK